MIRDGGKRALSGKGKTGKRGKRVEEWERDRRAERD